MILENYKYSLDEFTSYVVMNQKNGRGRMGNRWNSSKGNLHFSTLIKPKNRIKFWPQLSFISALAVKSSLSHYLIAKDDNIKFKWPNDIFIDNKKISGILIETTSDQKAVVVGIGINLINNPDIKNKYWKSINFLDYFGIKIIPEEISQLLLNEIMNFIKIWYVKGFPYIKNLWMKDALFLNEEMCSVDLKQNIKGTFIGLGELGQIIIQDKNNETTQLSTGTLLPTKLMK